MCIEKNDKSQPDEDTKIHHEYAQAYINILHTYDGHIQSTIKNKTKLKQDFFAIIKHIMYALLSLFGCTLLGSFLIFGMMIYYRYNSATIIAGSITAVVSSFVTMALSINKLPEIIAKYLFNKKEDKLMSEIINNIQNYEIGMVETTKQADINAAKDQKTKNYDNPYDENPNISKKKPSDMETIEKSKKNDKQNQFMEN